MLGFLPLLLLLLLLLRVLSFTIEREDDIQLDVDSEITHNETRSPLRLLPVLRLPLPPTTTTETLLLLLVLGPSLGWAS